MHAVRLAVGPGKEAFAPGAQQIAIVVEYGDRMLAAIEGIDIVLAVHPYCGTIPKRDLVRDFGPVFLDLERPFAVAEPLRHCSSRSCSTIIGRACWTRESPS